MNLIVPVSAAAARHERDYGNIVPQHRFAHDIHAPILSNLSGFFQLTTWSMYILFLSKNLLILLPSLCYAQKIIIIMLLKSDAAYVNQTYNNKKTFLQILTTNCVKYSIIIIIYLVSNGKYSTSNWDITYLAP